MIQASQTPKAQGYNSVGTAECPLRESTPRGAQGSWGLPRDTQHQEHPSSTAEMLETSKAAAADHTGQLNKRQKSPKILVFILLPSMGFDPAASLLQGKGDLTGQARPRRAGEQSGASLPKHMASTQTDSQHTVHRAPFHNPPCITLEPSLLLHTSTAPRRKAEPAGSWCPCCQLPWGHGSSGGFRDSVQVPETPLCLLPDRGQTKANLPNAQGQHRGSRVRY